MTELSKKTPDRITMDFVDSPIANFFVICPDAVVAPTTHRKDSG